MYPEVPAIFVDTGLEYPEIRRFVRTVDNVTWLRPAMKFKEVIKKYGYPVVSKDQSCAISRYRNTTSELSKKRRLTGWPGGKKGMISYKWRFLIDAPFKISDACCDVMKKAPLDKYVKETGRYPMTGMMAVESHNRQMQYVAQGCNAFDIKRPISWPIAFWLDTDIWEYLREYRVEYSSIYDLGEERTGCIFCCFGVTMESLPNRFQRMEKSHPKLHRYCMEKLGLREVLQYIGVEWRNSQLDMWK
jgi:3'-phosphoadenosine 5'-phosphosulfate sulfotransferase (PAPS reductase)/FAD synthetase